MGFFESIASTFGRSFDYEGRSSRSEYWYWVIFTALLGNPLGYFLGYFIVEGELDNGEAGIPACACFNGLVGTTVLATRQVETMPMQGRGFPQLVVDQQ